MTPHSDGAGSHAATRLAGHDQVAVAHAVDELALVTGDAVMICGEMMRGLMRSSRLTPMLLPDASTERTCFPCARGPAAVGNSLRPQASRRRGRGDRDPSPTVIHHRRERRLMCPASRTNQFSTGQ